MSLFSADLAAKYNEAIIYAETAIKQVQSGQPVSTPPLLNEIALDMYNGYQSGNWKIVDQNRCNLTI